MLTVQLRIRAGGVFRRYAVVISKTVDIKTVHVAYMATFGGKKCLPLAIDPVYWVPILPAERNNGTRDIYDPITSVNGIAQWVSIRRSIPLRGARVSLANVCLYRLSSVCATAR